MRHVAELPFPADAAMLAPLCADSIDALIEAEHRIEVLQSRLGLTRRIGIVLGIIMTTNGVDEATAEYLLRDRGKRLSRNMRAVAEQIIRGRAGVEAEPVQVGSAMTPSGQSV